MSTASDNPRIDVLIVEDSPTQMLLLRMILEKNGFAVTAAPHGRAGLEALATCRPALIISDVQMPEMDGYELCRRIKADPGRRELPFMLLTSLSSPQDIIHGLECGADNFVVKPYEEAFLLARIRSVLANCAMKKVTGDERGIAVEFGGRQYVINADRRQILNLLLSTYETAVKTNLDLIQAHEELKAAQAQLIEAEKLQSVGRLAAGVAHEVRNPLAILEMGLAFLVEQGGPEENQIILSEMREAVNRTNVVVTSLTDIAAPRALGQAATDVHGVIDSALATLASALVPGKVTVTRAYCQDPPPALLDGGQIEQAFVNVFTNALQAMPDGGQITVRTATKTLGAEDARWDPGARSGAHFRAGDRVLVVEVEDTGLGIAPEHLDKVFDPFFSTKPTGQGMGLGLTVARKLIHLHHGTITLRNAANGGALVTIQFPVCP